jgi:hypothetical protein
MIASEETHISDMEFEGLGKNGGLKKTVKKVSGAVKKLTGGGKEEAPPAPYMATEQPPEAFPWGMAAIGVGAVGALGTLVYFFMKSHKS